MMDYQMDRKKVLIAVEQSAGSSGDIEAAMMAVWLDFSTAFRLVSQKAACWVVR